MVHICGYYYLLEIHSNQVLGSVHFHFRHLPEVTVLHVQFYTPHLSVKVDKNFPNIDGDEILNQSILLTSNHLFFLDFCSNMKYYECMILFSL